MTNTWKAPAPVWDLMNDVKTRNHHPRLDGAEIGVCFLDGKAFTNNRLNWGKTVKFTAFNQIWHDRKYNFCIVLCADVWHSLLNDQQREALLDLHLTRCEVEYVAELDENGKPVKDEYGRVSYTQEVKTDDEGTPKWKVVPLDLVVFASNVRRYGCWCEEIDEFGDGIRGEQ